MGQDDPSCRIGGESWGHHWFELGPPFFFFCSGGIVVRISFPGLGGAFGFCTSQLRTAEKNLAAHAMPAIYLLPLSTHTPPRSTKKRKNGRLYGLLVSGPMLLKLQGLIITKQRLLPFCIWQRGAK